MLAPNTRHRVMRALLDLTMLHIPVRSQPIVQVPSEPERSPLCPGGGSMASVPKRRPKPWAETGRQGRTRYVWRFGVQKYRTPFYDDPEEARADATAQITAQLQGTWRDPAGPRTPLEDWIDVWAGMLHDIEPTTLAYYRYLVEFHILAKFQGRE